MNIQDLTSTAREYRTIQAEIKALQEQADALEQLDAAMEVQHGN